MEDPSTSFNTLISESDSDPTSTCTQDSPEYDGSGTRSKPTEILRALEVVERDSVAIAESFSSLFASLRLALSEVTGSSVDHMRCFSDAAGRIQESALDAATKGNRYINSCLRFHYQQYYFDLMKAQELIPSLGRRVLDPKWLPS